MTLESQDHLDDIKTHARAQPDGDATFAWIEPPAAAPHSPRTRWWRTSLAAACVLATLVTLLVTQARAGESSSQPAVDWGAIALQTNVPWALVMVDDDTQPVVISGDLGLPRELATHAFPHGAPGLSISTAPGRHVVSLVAEGFASRRATVTVVRDRVARLQLPLVPTPSGRAAMLAAVDNLLGSMPASMPAASDAPWLASLGLEASTAPLDVEVRFHAVALDPRDPFFATSDAGEPAPAPGTLGVAVLVSAQISAIDSRAGRIVAQRTLLLGEQDAVCASVWYDDVHWMASGPFLRDGNELATAQSLLALAQRAGPTG